MAEKIDSIRVDGTDYTFTLSSNSSLTISGLTVTGSITADTINADTANLAVINFGENAHMTSSEIYLRDFNTLGIYLNSVEVSMDNLSMNASTLNLSASQIILNANRTFKINSGVFFKDGLTISKDTSIYTANLLNDGLQFSGSLISNTSYNVNNISYDGYIYSFPTKSGTLALNEDINTLSKSINNLNEKHNEDIITLSENIDNSIVSLLSSANTWANTQTFNATDTNVNNLRVNGEITNDGAVYLANTSYSYNTNASPTLSWNSSNEPTTESVQNLEFSVQRANNPRSHITTFVIKFPNNSSGEYTFAFDRFYNVPLVFTQIYNSTGQINQILQEPLVITKVTVSSVTFKKNFADWANYFVLVIGQ